MDSVILSDIKNLLGIKEITAFDNDLIMHINSVFMILKELGVGPTTGFAINDGFETWSDFLGDDFYKIEAVRSYVFLKVKLIFDPPSSGTVMQSIKELIAELEWRLNVEVDPTMLANF